MTKKQYICDQCEKDVNGSGYCVGVDYSNTEYGLLEIVIATNLDADLPTIMVESHFCGRNCLMLGINKMIDAINSVRANGRSPLHEKG